MQAQFFVLAEIREPKPYPMRRWLFFLLLIREFPAKIVGKSLEMSKQNYFPLVYAVAVSILIYHTGDYL